MSFPFALRPITLATAVALAPLPALAQDGPLSFADLFSVDRLARIGVQFGLVTARSFVDLTYDDIAFNLLAGRLALTGLSVSPRAEPGTAAGARCLIQADRAILASGPLDELDVSRVRIEAVGLSVNRACMDRDLRSSMDQIGLSEISLDRAFIDVAYTFSSGALNLRFQAISDDLLEVEGRVDFSYFAMDARDTESNPVPVAHLASARFELADRGLWKQLGPLLPPQFADPAMVEHMIATDGVGAFIEMNGGAPLSASQTAFLGDLAAEVARFTDDGGRLVLDIAPVVPVVLDEALFAQPRVLFDLLAPSIGAEAASAPEALSAADMAQIPAALSGDAAALSNMERLRIARVLQIGEGAPRDVLLALALIEPLAEAGDGEALAMALEMVDALDNDLAYEVALQASAHGVTGALAALDRLEPTLPLATVLELQAQAAGELILPAPDERMALRDQAFAALTGIGGARSYAHAYVLALLGTATGDSGAESVLDELDQMRARTEGDDRALWDGLVIDATSLASAHWFAE